MSGQPVLLVDMDSTITNWIGGVIRAATVIAQARRLRPELVPSIEQFTRFSVEECFAGEQLALVKAAMCTAQLYLGLEPIGGAMEALRCLEAEGVQVSICTSPDLNNPTCADDKLAWLRRHGGEDLARRAVITKDKTAVRGTILVDDKPQVTGRFDPAWTHVLFHQPHNETLPGLRLRSWNDWPQLLPLLAADGSDGQLPAA